MVTGAACTLLDKAVNGFGGNSMSNIDYHAMSDGELVNHLEKGEMQTNPDFYAEFMRRMEEEGTLYRNTPEDAERWKADIASSARRGFSLGSLETETRVYQEALAEGRYEGELAVVLRLLTRRLGQVESQWQSQMQQLSSTQLEALADALLDFSTTADLVAWLQAHQQLP